MTDSDLTAALTDLVLAPRPLDGVERERAAAAFADTLAVVHAGWHEPVTQRLLSLYAPGARPMTGRPMAALPEIEALILGTAGHALDYDDVQLASVTHPSVVLVPALLALSGAGQGARERILPAFAVGLAVNIALGQALGFGHYRAGWHATSTIGPLAAAAACAHLMGLPRDRIISALSIATAQAGGLQLNFGTEAKPLQAGLAAAAGVRAALLAQTGLTAAADPLAARGFLDLYAPGTAQERGRAVVPLPRIDLDTISVKLFPCCYAAHRMIAAAIDAHHALGTAPGPEDRVRLTVPDGLMTPLLVTDPRTGAEGKFCAAYTVAAALIQGRLGLADFTDAAIARGAVRDLMARIEIIEDDPGAGAAGPGIDHGTVRLAVLRSGRTVCRTEAEFYPGAPQRPARPEELTQKIADCLADYRRRAGEGLSLAQFQDALGRSVGMLQDADA